MRCDEVRSLLPEHAGGGLADPLGLGIETHLAGCADCRAEFAELRNVCALLDEAAAPIVQVDAVRLREEALRRASRRVRRWRRIAVAALAASVVLAFLALLPRLDIRHEHGRLVVIWDRPSRPTVAVPNPPTVRVDDERLQRLEQLVHALALDVQNREVVQQQELVRLQVELERLRQESVNFRVSTEQDVSTLTRHLQQSMKEKGDMP